MRQTTLTLTVVAAVLATAWAAADPVAPLVPGSVQEQHLVLPPDDADVPQVLKQLEAKEEGVKEAALQWLLRREGAEKLASFQTASIRFSVEAVTQVSVEGEPWRLVECAYLARQADRIGRAEYRARWPVAYLFDSRARLRDWVADYDVALVQDINVDGKPELIAYIDSPKRVIVYSYELGKSRELLRVDGVPERGELLKTTARKEGGAYMTYEKPVELIADKATAVIRLKVAQHGIYEWDERQERYVHENDRDGK